MASRRKPAVSDELLDQLLEGTDALEAFQSGDLVQDLKKALAERILNAEPDHHLEVDPILRTTRQQNHSVVDGLVSVAMALESSQVQAGYAKVRRADGRMRSTT